MAHKKNSSTKLTKKKQSKSLRLRDIINNFPDLPGVYLMKDNNGAVIYAGKANSIKKRVKSYFTAAKDKRPTLKFLLPKIDDIEFIVTKSEKEALILENTLIKKYKPKFNINLKDDKNFFSLKLTVKHKFPKILLTRRVKKDGGVYFGPYSSSCAVRETIEILRNIFMLRTCSDSTLNNRSRACLNHQIKTCSAPCVGKISEDDYRKSVAGTKMFLNGDVKGLIRALKRPMKEASRKERYEEAARLRDQINAVNLTVEKQRAVTHKSSMNNDIIGLYSDGGDASINVITVRGGSITSIKNHVFLGNMLADSEALSSFLKQFYHGDKEIPREIVLNKIVDDSSLIKEWLIDKRGSIVTLKAPKRGESRRIMEMALENAKQSLINKRKLENDIGRDLETIRTKLNLTNLPKVIECYDISNIMGKHAVGSRVVLRDGALDKSLYRKYKIKTKSEADDYGMMYEVLKRRFKKDDDRPDLLMIDGGKGHLSIALKVMDELGISNVDAISLAKEKRQNSEIKDERIYLPGRKNPVMIKKVAAFNKLIILRNEAHRFAISYHKKLRAKDATMSMFDNIKGIGPKKRALLLTNISGIADVTEANLNKIKGLNKKDIENILKYLWWY